MLTLGDVITFFKADTKEFDDALEKTEEDSKGWVGRVGGIIGNGLKDAAVYGVVNLTKTLASLSVEAFNLATDFKTVTNDLQAQFGLTSGEAQVLSDHVANIFGNNWGNDVEDVKQALIDVRTNMKDLNDQDLEQATQSAIALRDVFGLEFQESSNAANTLMTEFGLNSKEAFDFLTAAQQRGLNSSGDLLDTIGEYSPQFSAAGFTAEEFFSTMESGLQGGVLGTDKVTDAIKEMRLRLNGGADDLKGAFTSMGLNYDKMAASVASGDETWADYFDKIQNGLKSIDDPIKREAAGVAIFGSQWEDAGSAAILGIDMTKTSLADLEGSTDSLNVKYSNLGSMFTGVWRKVQTEVLLPLGEKMLEFGNKIMPFVSEAINAIGAAIGGDTGGLAGIVSKIGPIFDSIWPAIQKAVEGIIGMMIQSVATKLPEWLETVGGLAEGFIKWIVDAGPALLTNIANAWTGLVTWIVGKLPEWVTLLGQLGAMLGQWVIDYMPTLMTNLGTAWTALVTWVQTNAPTWAAELMKLGAGLYEWVLASLPELGTKLGEALAFLINWVVESLPGWIEELKKLGGAMIQWVMDALPGLATNLGEMLGALLGWVGQTALDVLPELVKLAGKFFGWIVTDVIPALPGELAKILKALGDFIDNTIKALAPTLTNLAIKFYSWITDEVLPQIPIKLGEIWTAIDGWITQTAKDAWEAAKAIGENIADGISGAIETGLNGLYTFVSGIINPIITAINATIDGLNLVNPFDDIPHIPYMAQGGITRDGLVYLGDGPGGLGGLERVRGHGIDVLAGAGLYDVPAGLRVTPAQQTLDELRAGMITARPSRAGGDRWERAQAPSGPQIVVQVDARGATDPALIEEAAMRGGEAGAKKALAEAVLLADQA